MKRKIFWLIPALAATIVFGLAAGYWIDTFDDKQFWLGSILTLPVSILVFKLIVLRGKGWTVEPGKLLINIPTLAAITLVFWPSCMGLLEFANAVKSSATIEDEVTVLDLHGSKASVRRSENFSAEFQSRKGLGQFKVGLAPGEFSGLQWETAYSLKYQIGIFGWKFKTGRLDIRRIATNSIQANAVPEVKKISPPPLDLDSSQMRRLFNDMDQ